MRRFGLTRVLSILAAVAIAASVPAVAGSGKTYGEPLTGSDTTPISKLLSDPEPYLGKTVRVEGTVTGVCEKRGCWMSLASDREFEELRIKAEDGVIVFPVASKGHHAVAEGVFTKIELTLEQTVMRARHHAEEHGEGFDPDAITEPLTLYQINVTGAVID
jgi:hypothetical protein